MKAILLFLILVCFNELITAQETTILKTLNRELKKELKNQFKSDNFDGDTLHFVQEFKIDKNQILSFQIKKTSSNFSGYQIIQQEVPLLAILKLSKDVQMILETKDKAVATHYLYSDNDIKAETTYDRFFYLYITDKKESEALGISLQKAFFKAGYNVKKDFWYDK